MLPSGPLEERLREAAALGDLEEVQALVGQGAQVDAPNEVNGWTCLHWACKRNHIEVVAYLLDSGANKEIFTVNGELAAHLTSKKEIRMLLGECDNQEMNHLKLPVSANDVTNPLLCANKEGRDSVLDTPSPSEDTRTIVTCLPEGKSNTCLSTIQTEDVCPTFSMHSEDYYKEDFTSPINAEATACMTPPVQGCPVYPSPASHNRVLFSSAASQHVPQQANGSCTGNTEPLQPLLLTGNFPYNTQELVLKVRVQNPKENDFIEVELDRQELTYQDLLRVSCCELGINPEQVEKIRKLPNTLDKDVSRLQDFQELELVLERSISSPFRNPSAPTAMDIPYYNTKAAKLTY
ncbi:ankyrin repeat domain-containing protein 40-like isoform X2 [Sceloporus undulatus]|uniref:ankyrin repeat domain-containing protein 40-like isoform X2 n=1 Tax=Sceloporus undulatus TaxID=8520 RepID=UPI001C4B6364|nr:ankyrin repeat domain-containing protein 40-like isoform X2 [Sceloporus undulatus]